FRSPEVFRRKRRDQRAQRLMAGWPPWWPTLPPRVRFRSRFAKSAVPEHLCCCMKRAWVLLLLLAAGAVAAGPPKVAVLVDPALKDQPHVALVESALMQREGLAVVERSALRALVNEAGLQHLAGDDRTQRVAALQ